MKRFLVSIVCLAAFVGPAANAAETTPAGVAGSIPPASDVGAVAPALEKYATGPLAGLWRRPGLSLRDRAIVTVAALIARDQTGDMRAYFALALDNGVEWKKSGARRVVRLRTEVGTAPVRSMWRKAAASVRSEWPPTASTTYCTL